ncbi:MAG TPA: AarF/UbiB family protein [Kofleriaceae bacterium]|nr:AarF/UbiB family protein [Kofleriaceae bacterium]
MNDFVRMLKQVGTRLDALSIDLARDAGAIVRNAQALSDSINAQVATIVHATPRVTKLGQHAAALFAKARWMGIVNAAKTGDARLTADDHRELARKTAAIAAELRGGIAKLGQLASCRPDLVGAIWATELAALQADVPAIDAARIREQIVAELGEPIETLFATFDDEPLAAASLAQVHTATLHDGTRVVVKVQVPGIDDVIAADTAALRTLAGALDIPGIDLATIASELTRALTIELDYVVEAASLASYDGAAIVPKSIAKLSTRRVLTMTRIDGDRLGGWLEHHDQRDDVLRELVGEVAAQILIRGQVHADPHPGNFLVTPAGKLALLDFGCMLELSADERAAYARLVLAIAGGNGAATARELETLGFRADDPDQLVDLASAIVGALRPGVDTATLDWQAAFADQIAASKQLGGLQIPRSFVLLGRVLVSVAGLLATYKPRLELHPLLASYLARAIA